jgi:hypothetical protein
MPSEIEAPARPKAILVDQGTEFVSRGTFERAFLSLDDARQKCEVNVKAIAASDLTTPISNKPRSTGQRHPPALTGTSWK